MAEGDKGKERLPPPPEGRLAEVVDRNIRALVARRRQDEREKDLQAKIADAITRFTGSMLFVYIHLLVFGLWIVINLGWLPFVPRLDPTFVILAMAASVEAIFLSTFVLISQNRMAEMEDRRADLDLQISLLAEHEVTRLITLVVAIAESMNIQEAANPELSELARDVAPEAVMDRMDQTAQDVQRSGNNGRRQEK